jgi:T5SS/PEP-CTERM-associated repeat protein
LQEGIVKSPQRRYLVVATALSLFAGYVARSGNAAITTGGDLSAAVGVPYNGTDNPWSTDSLIVGNSAPGSMTIDAGYVVQNNAHGIIAYGSTASTSSVVVTGAGSSWTNSDFLNVGPSGTATLNITNGGTVSSKGGFVGGGNSAVTIGGGVGTSLWTTNKSPIHVGVAGIGKLDITGSGRVTSTGGYIGLNPGSSGAVTVDGAAGPAVWMSSSSIAVGGYGTGTLNVTSGGTVASVGGYIGEYDGSKGTVNVGGGIGLSSWTTGYLFVGNVGNGSLNIMGGGSVASSVAEIRYDSTVTVGGGAGPSQWALSSALDFSASSARLNIKAGGTVSALKIDDFPFFDPLVNFDGGTLRITSTDAASGKITLLAGGGSIDVPTAATKFTIAGAIGGSGGLTKTGQSVLGLTVANTYTGGTTVIEGMLTLSGATAKLGTGNVSIESSTAGSVLQIQSGVSNAIANTATLSLFDGSSGGSLSAGIAADLVPNRAYVDLGAGINETVSVLLLNGVAQGPGTYGSSISSATFKNDSFFAGSGVITVLIPEPASATLLLLGLVSLITCKRWQSNLAIR